MSPKETACPAAEKTLLSHVQVKRSWDVLISSTWGPFSFCSRGLHVHTVWTVYLINTNCWRMLTAHMQVPHMICTKEPFLHLKMKS